ncbi:MAG: carboxylesterase family protein [Acidimicrobiia bacterium]|nr:carboxylesterase family protein [Acidimicrobiia bacterium]
MDGPVATTSTGLLGGRRCTVGGGDVLGFGGVPYAAAPVGPARFASPQPPAPWSDIRDATRPGAAPPQPAGDELLPGLAPERTSEDCLTLEIWTPALDGERPVLVWIPGGGFQTGGAGLATYDGSRLAAEHDLVVVGVNYRLGALGFAALDGAPTNQGLRDLATALEWISTEIAAFGGNASRVTLMGESAGAGAIAHLLTAPAVRGLVHGAVMQSGAPAATLDHDRAATVAEAFCAAAGTDDLEHLRVLPIDAIVAAQDEAARELLVPVGKMPFHPWIDDDVVPTTPLDAARVGSLAPVPLVVGTNAHEMALFADQVPELPAEVATRLLRPKLDAVFGVASDPSAPERGLDACGDLLRAIADVDLHLPALVLADAHAGADHRVHRYRFDWDGTGTGAAHAHDLPFTFGTLDVSTWRHAVGAPADGPADELSARMRTAWASFARSGVPSCDPVGEWPDHDPEHWETVVLDAELRIVAELDRPRLDTWRTPSSRHESR